MAVQVGAEFGFRPQDSGDEIFLRVLPGLFWGDFSPGHQGLHHGVIPGKAADAVRSNQICPAVPDVQQIGRLLHHKRSHHRGAHTAAIGVDAGAEVDRLVGLLRSEVKHSLRFIFPLFWRLCPGRFEKGLHRHMAGHIAGLGATHTVTDDGEPHILLE